MKQFISVLTGICFVIALTCALALLWTEWSFSFLLKLLLLASSAFIGLTAFRTSNFSKLLFLFAILCVTSLAAILFYPSFYPLLWNSVLAGHILLIGFVFYLEVKSHQPSLLRKITIGTLIPTIFLFVTVVILKIQHPLFYTALFLLLALISTLLIISKLISLIRK